DLYRGEFLSGSYEEWALTEQTYWAERYFDALAGWSEALEGAGRLEAALAVAQQAVGADPHREDAYCRELRLYAAMGRMPAALEAYRTLERRLEEELGIAP